MSPAPAVVLNCAGFGRRLGLGQTKALVDLHGRPLIHWQLDLLEEITDIRVVVGYNAESVIKAVVARRPDAVFVFNHAFETTATGDSLLKAAEHIEGDLVSLDGDLLVRPDDLALILAASTAVLGVTPALSDDPICIDLTTDGEGAVATGFSRQRSSAWEWTGLMKCAAGALVASPRANSAGPHHVYQLAEPLLPIRALAIDTREIDTPGDYERAAHWLATQTIGGRWA